MVNKNDYKIERDETNDNEGLTDFEKEALEITLKHHKKAFEMLAMD